VNQEKYIGMDVHQATISVAAMDAGGKLIMELLETKAATIVEFIRGLLGTLSLTFEEGKSAAWLHDLLKPHVSQLVALQFCLALSGTPRYRGSGLQNHCRMGGWQSLKRMSGVISPLHSLPRPPLDLRSSTTVNSCRDLKRDSRD